MFFCIWQLVQNMSNKRSLEKSQEQIHDLVSNFSRRFFFWIMYYFPSDLWVSMWDHSIYNLHRLCERLFYLRYLKWIVSWDIYLSIEPLLFYLFIFCLIVILALSRATEIHLVQEASLKVNLYSYFAQWCSWQYLIKSTHFCVSLPRVCCCGE